MCGSSLGAVAVGFAVALLSRHTHTHTSLSELLIPKSFSHAVANQLLACNSISAANVLPSQPVTTFIADVFGAAFIAPGTVADTGS